MWMTQWVLRLYHQGVPIIVVGGIVFVSHYLSNNCHYSNTILVLEDYKKQQSQSRASFTHQECVKCTQPSLTCQQWMLYQCHLTHFCDFWKWEMVYVLLYICGTKLFFNAILQMQLLVHPIMAVSPTVIIYNLYEKDKISPFQCEFEQSRQR